MKKRSRTYAVISSYILKIFLFCLITANSIPSKAEDFRITGIKLLNNTIFSQEEIDEIAKDYLNRSLDFDDILSLQYKFTKAYTDRGHFTSFVNFDSQSSEGILTYRAWEGTVKLDVTGSGIRDSYIESKLNRYLSAPLNKKNLEEGLSLLRADPLIGDISSSINPTEIEGQSLLSVKARGNPPWSLGSEVSNDENPAVGSWGVRTFFENNSFLGGGERFQAEYKVTEGLERWLVGFSIPIPRTGSTVEFLYQEGDSRIVDGVLESFEVENDSYVASFRFRQTIKENLQENFAISFGVDRRNSNSFALGEEVSDLTLTAIRWDQSYVRRTNNILGIIISQFSVGVPDKGSTFDGTFFSWQGQGQILYDFGPGQLYARAALQLTPDGLPAIEQCAIGGRNGNQFIFGNIVRGYATNSRLGDNCAAGSLEVRFPLYRGGGFEAIAFPFVDVGYVWNNKGVSIDTQTLIGTGFGVRLSYRQALLVQANYGFALNDPDNPLENITQGLSFSVLGRIRF